MFDPARHYPLLQLDWDVESVQQTISEIASATEAQLEATMICPTHPMDEYGFGSDLYFGTAGLLWALAYLQEIKAIDSTFPVATYLEETLAHNRQSYKKGPYPDQSSFLFGELPILLLQYKLAPSPAKATEILHTIHQNDHQPVRELMWGVPGTMLAAHFMYQWTGENQWAEAFRQQAFQVLQEWQPIDDIGFLWTIDLYGSQEKYLGPVHGFASNLTPLLLGKVFFTDDQFQEIAHKAMQTVVNTAVVDEDCANWPAIFHPDNPCQPPKLVQYCHGAPGMVTALSLLPKGENERFDQLLEQGGELTWRAGPLKKGSNLCHGTAGNGYAFLKLFERTGDQMWLDRAKAFAMHAIEQYKLSRQLYGQLRYTLWTGDLGLAIYLWDCLQIQAKFPTIDVF